MVLAVIAGLALAGTATTAAVAVAQKRKRAMSERVRNYNGSLCAYLEAVRSQRLDAGIIDGLITELNAVKEYSDGSITVDLSTKHFETLVQFVIDYTRQLAEANSVELDEPSDPSPTSTDAAVVDLLRYLEVQRMIFHEAA